MQKKRGGGTSDNVMVGYNTQTIQRNGRVQWLEYDSLDITCLTLLCPSPKGCLHTNMHANRAQYAYTPTQYACTSSMHTFGYKNMQRFGHSHSHTMIHTCTCIRRRMNLRTGSIGRTLVRHSCAHACGLKRRYTGRHCSWQGT